MYALLVQGAGKLVGIYGDGCGCEFKYVLGGYDARARPLYIRFVRISSGIITWVIAERSNW